MNELERKAERYYHDLASESIESKTELHNRGFIGDNVYEIRKQKIEGNIYYTFYVNDEQFNDNYDSLLTIEDLIEDLQNYERIVNA